MIETIDQGAIGTAGPGAAGDGEPGESGAESSDPTPLDPGTPDDVVEALARLRPGADAHRRGAGAGPVNELLAGLAAAVGGCGTHDPEFGGVLVVELARRYLHVVGAHGRGAEVPRVWQLVLDSWTDPGGAARERITLAGAHALVGHDLPPAVVTTCTLLGRAPGPAERADLQAAVVLLAGIARDAARHSADPATLDDAADLEPLLTRGDCGRQAEHLWTVRGRPSEADRDREALDRRAALVVRGLLAGPS